MRKIKLKIKKKECAGTCPIPLELIPKVTQGIIKIAYDEENEMAEITYDEKILSKEEVINKLTKIGYITSRE